MGEKNHCLFWWYLFCETVTISWACSLTTSTFVYTNGHNFLAKWFMENTASLVCLMVCCVCVPAGAACLHVSESRACTRLCVLLTSRHPITQYTQPQTANTKLQTLISNPRLTRAGLPGFLDDAWRAAFLPHLPHLHGTDYMGGWCALAQETLKGGLHG